MLIEKVNYFLSNHDICKVDEAPMHWFYRIYSIFIPF